MTLFKEMLGDSDGSDADDGFGISQIRISWKGFKIFDARLI